jgi:hypothetical protein
MCPIQTMSMHKNVFTVRQQTRRDLMRKRRVFVPPRSPNINNGNINGNPKYRKIDAWDPVELRHCRPSEEIYVRFGFQPREAVRPAVAIKRTQLQDITKVGNDLTLPISSKLASVFLQPVFANVDYDLTRQAMFGKCDAVHMQIKNKKKSVKVIENTSLIAIVQGFRPSYCVCWGQITDLHFTFRTRVLLIPSIKSSWANIYKKVEMLQSKLKNTTLNNTKSLYDEIIIINFHTHTNYLAQIIIK